MTSKIKKLDELGLLDNFDHRDKNPKELPAFATNPIFEVISGSTSYGVDNDGSDVDIQGIYICPREMFFPHLEGHIIGFGPARPTFDSYSIHHIKHDGIEYDVTLYSLVKYADLALKGNPNIIDTVFTPPSCILHMEEEGEHFYDNRKLFLSKYAVYKMLGFARGHYKKLTEVQASRQDNVDKYGYDVKGAYHIVRMLLQAEYVIKNHDLEIDVNSEILNPIKLAKLTLDEFLSYTDRKIKHVMKISETMTLPEYADYDELKIVLNECLEINYSKY